MKTEPLFVANGLITLTSDFGEREPFVGLMKAVILGRFADARIVDLCHGLPKFQPDVAGFWLERCWPYFPAGTVHLAVVDPGVGSARLMKCLKLAGQVFVGPDNGLLDSLEQLPGWQESRVFGQGELGHLNLGPISRTFHGRDVFAPLVAELAAGRQQPEALGRAVVRSPVEFHAANSDTTAVGRIRVIDDFGNLLTDIAESRLDKSKRSCVMYGSQLIEIKETYSAVKPGELVALVNSFGVVEIAVAMGSAAQKLNARIGDRIELIAQP